MCVWVPPEDTGERVLVRGCALDSGQLIPDSDVIKVSHCGGLIFQDRWAASRAAGEASLVIRSCEFVGVLS